MKSINTSIICTVPKIDLSLKAEVKSGFASISQKKNTVPLTVLFDYEGENLKIPKNSTVYVKEEDLMVHAWAKHPTNIRGVEAIIVPLINILAIDTEA